jgi:hypothetical protein
MEPSSETPASGHPTRRTTIRAAAAGAGAVWIMPLVQTISMDSASAMSSGGNSQGQNTNNQGPNRH